MASGRGLNPGGVPLPGGRALPGARTFGPWQTGLLIAALLLGGLGGYWGFTKFYEASHAPPQVGQPVRVVRTTIRNTVSATGTVTATEQSNLTFQATGQITDIFVKAGDQVQQGQPIASLDGRSAMLARDQARSNLASTQAKLDALLAGATPDVVAAARQAVASAQSGVMQAQSTVTNAQAGVTQAQSAITSAQSGITTAQATLTKSQNDLAALLNGPQPTDIEQVQAQVDKATSDLQIAQTNYDRLVTHSDVATRPEVTQLAVAKQNFQTAQTNYLAKLTPPLSTDVAQAQTNLKLGRDALQAAQLRNLQVQADPTAAISDKLAAQNAVSAAQAQIDNAQSNIQKLQQGTDQLDISAAQSQIDNARVALQAAQANYNNLIALSDVVTRPEFSALAAAASEYETARAAYDAKVAPPLATDVSSGQAAIQAAQAGIPSSQASLNTAQANVPSSQAQLQAAQANVPSAQAQLQAAQAKLAQTVGPPLPTDVTQATEAVNTAQLQLQQAQLTLDNETLKAPFTGIIVSVPAHIGDQVSAATVITTLTNPNALEVDANVDETSVTQLKPGQQATVTLDALPGRTFNATVAAVTPSGTTQQGVVVFPIVFRLDTQGQTVPAGASANITVTTATTPNVLAVPARYVHRQGTNQVVDVLENNKRVMKVVTTGVTNGQLTEITSGLQVGDIAIPPQQNRQGATFGAGGNVGGGGGPPGGAP